jgi:aspartate aminotransferase-like enzyme
MISEKINLSTGPVSISMEVQNALIEPSISHRSDEFKRLLSHTTELLNHAFGVKETFILSGSGTLANEVMLQEIKHIEGKGLILSNGEFGNRLIEQANRNHLQFKSYNIEWGAEFQIEKVLSLINETSCTWLLFCHCETSTGIVNDLKMLTSLARSNNCQCYVDCMSTVGTMPLDLSGVAMATASSGKGLASIPGLALVFSNRSHLPRMGTPLYLDLGHYSGKSGIPFTLSSNLLKALYISIKQKLKQQQFELMQQFGEQIFQILSAHDLVPFSNAYTPVFTIITTNKTALTFLTGLMRKDIILSTESDYLKKRRWYQLALFGYYTKRQLDYVLNCFDNLNSIKGQSKLMNGEESKAPKLYACELKDE